MVGVSVGMRERDADDVVSIIDDKDLVEEAGEARAAVVALEEGEEGEEEDEAEGAEERRDSLEVVAKRLLAGLFCMYKHSITLMRSSRRKSCEIPKCQVNAAQLMKQLMTSKKLNF